MEVKTYSYAISVVTTINSTLLKINYNYNWMAPPIQRRGFFGYRWLLVYSRHYAVLIVICLDYLYNIVTTRI